MIQSAITRGIVILVLVAALAVHPASQNAGTAQSELVYIALGDSIPAGLLASLPAARGYPALVRDLIEAQHLASDSPANVELVNLAEPGETVQTFQENGQLEEAIEQIQALPDGSLQTVTLSIGGNNILSLWESNIAERETELQQFQSEFNAVIDDLASALDGTDADVVVTTYYDLTEGDPTVDGSNAWWLRQFNNVVAETASDAGFDIVDVEPLFQGQISELTWFPADIHPNNAGHQVIARAIWQELGYDETAPEIEITRPDSSEVRNRVPTIHATVSEDVRLESVILHVEGEDLHELMYVASRETWIGLWDAREFEGNEAELTVVATDVSGNEASDIVTVTLPSR
jgi:lysophospholipase L1-like esterase